MPDLIHMTLQYSNAVLVALLPHFSDFAEKLELPVPAPITTNEVARFAPRRLPGDVGGTLFLTNGWRFGFHRGHVEAFEAPRNYLTLQEPDRIPEFFGTVNLDTNQAIRLARDTLKRMGYAGRLPKTTNSPSTLEGPRKWRGHILPYYLIEWRWNTGNSEHAVVFNIDADKRSVTRFYVTSTNLWRDPPPIDVVIELESEYQKRVIGSQQIQRRGPPPGRTPPP